MKKKIILGLLLFTTITFSNLFCYKDKMEDNNYTEALSYKKIENPKLYKSYLLVDDNTGKILIEDNKDIALPIASLTKLMTAMVVLDNIDDINKKVKITYSEANIPYGVRLTPNKEYKIIDLLQYMLIMSSNSSAKALADNISKDFSSLMNKKASEIGLENSSFCTPNGLPPKYTNKCIDIASAMDIYKISKYAIDNYPLISEITSTKYKNVDGINLINSNELLRTMKNIKGIKTGYHRIAGYNISILYDNGVDRLYEVILGSDSEKDRKDISKIVLNSFENKE